LTSNPITVVVGENRHHDQQQALNKNKGLHFYSVKTRAIAIFLLLGVRFSWNDKIPRASACVHLDKN